MGLSKSFPGRHQEIYADSCIIIETKPALEQIADLTVQAFIFPTIPDSGEQSLITKWCASEQKGFALFINESGCTSLRIGDGNGATQDVSGDVQLSPHEWYFVAGNYNSKTGDLAVFQESIRNRNLSKCVDATQATDITGPILSNGIPLMMAASCVSNSRGGNVGDNHFNGKIDSPRLSGDVLSLDEMKTLQSSPLAQICRVRD